jgi:proteasome lid subunit RPN8/RPN11
LILGRTLAEQIFDHSVREHPLECCGLIAGRDGVAERLYPIANVARSERRYLMDAAQQTSAIRDADLRGLDILAIYHSHIHAEARPSAVDVTMAVRSGWLDVLHVLVSLQDIDRPAMRWFIVSRDGEVIEQPISLA